MNDCQIKLLDEIYNNYLSGSNCATFMFQKMSYKEKEILNTNLLYLKEKGFIEYIAQALGFIEIRLTAYGIDFVKNGFQEAESKPLVQLGNNSIYVNGSENTITDNYNQISIDIKNSDLPNEYKKLIETLIYELKNPNLPKEKKSEKISKFLSEIASDSLTSVATSGLTTLLMSLFDNISL